MGRRWSEQREREEKEKERERERERIVSARKQKKTVTNQVLSSCSSDTTMDNAEEAMGGAAGGEGDYDDSYDVEEEEDEEGERLQRSKQGQKSQSKEVKAWSKAEDALLIEAVGNAQIHSKSSKNQNWNWKKIAESVHIGRNHVQCRNRWKIINPLASGASFSSVSSNGDSPGAAEIGGSFAGAAKKKVG